MTSSGDGDVGSPPRPSRDIEALLAIMAALRDPAGGCPWDLAQDFATIAPYTIEEAFEVADAVARGDLDDLRDELGDLLLQVVFHARMAEERGAFSFGDVVEAITAKLIRRHPHVFGDARDLSADQVKALWDTIKAGEKRLRAERTGVAPTAAGVLDEVAVGMPALIRADRLARAAARVGFTWPDARSVLDKVDEELGELRDAVRGRSKQEIADEIGDVLFTVTNLARHLDIHPEAALAATNRKFERRFRRIETALAAEGRRPEDATLAEMDRLWVEAKAAERDGRGVSDPPRLPTA